MVIYLTDVEEGGETVFPNGKALDGSDKSHDEVLRELSGKGIDLAKMGIRPGSWEERLVVQCRSKLAVKPCKTEAVLFYDQLPQGGQDEAHLHGGCPVLKGTKWAANLWVWNGNVHGDDRAGAAGVKQEEESQLLASFVSRLPGHSLYWEDTFFMAMAADEPVRMNTFEGHVFHIHEGRDEASKGKRVATFKMGPKTGRTQTYVYPAEPDASEPEPAAGAQHGLSEDLLDEEYEFEDDLEDYEYEFEDE